MIMGREEDMEELSLELSIGGKYGKAEELKEKTTEFCGGGKSDFVASRCDFPGAEAMDPWRRREIQSLRRQEARRKREEKVKKSRGVSGVDKLFSEAQRFQARARDREMREKDCFFESKNRENGSTDGVGEELGISIFSEKKERKKECLYPKVQFAAPLIVCDSEYSNGVRSLDRCSSAVSDYHSMSQKGESNSDTGSHSSPMHRRHVDRINSSSLAGSDRCLIPAEGSNADSSPSPGGGVTKVSSTSETLSKQSSHSLNAACLPRMPCVSATGNGPNGRTVTGFLYRYNKTEVSIMCVCHGRSFSPAGFVEHAGGVDITHPLRHITVVPFGPPVAR